MGPVAEPVGLAEIAERLGVQRKTAVMWRQRALLPEPRWTVSGSPAWDWPDIERWAVATGRAVTPGCAARGPMPTPLHNPTPRKDRT